VHWMLEVDFLVRALPSFIHSVKLPPVPDTQRIAVVSPLWTAWVHRLLRGALGYAEARGHFVLREFHLPRGFGLSDRTLQTLRKWQPHGVICHLEEQELRRLMHALRQSAPVVNVGATRPQPGVTRVTGRFAMQAEVAVRHLRHQGLRSLALLLLEDLAEQQAAFVEVFQRVARPSHTATATCCEVVSPGLLDNPSSRVVPVPARLAAWLRQLPKPTGIFCPQSGGGGYLIRVCHALGWRVPGDLSVVGVDDSDVCLASEPTLTSVLVSGEQVGREALRQLERMIRREPGIPELVRTDTMDLHVRESTGSRPAEVCDIAAALDHINQYACVGLSVERLVRETQHVSKVTFHKHFQAATGQSPGRAILQRQLDEARRLLAESKLSVTAVAEQCGFGSSSDFARRFKLTEGQTPGAYRALHARG